MCPVLLLFLLLAVLNQESASVPEDNTGLNFIVAFPENIAYYHPTAPKNQVHITALYDNTQVTIKQYIYDSTTETLSAGETRDFILNAKLELNKKEISNNTLQITGTKNITVHAMSYKANSVQTAVVIPIDKLGTEYLIPPIPTIQGTTVPADEVTTSVTERSPFRLIVVNADQQNKVTVEGSLTNEVPLQPYQSVQIFVKEEAALRAVKTDQPAAVLFGHSCAMHHNCTCRMLYTLLPVANEKKLKFLIPPVITKNVEDETFLLLSRKQSKKVQAFNQDSPQVETTGTAVLYRPGLLLSLIPETDFASCYVINSIPNMNNFAVIVVHKDLADGVHIKSLPLENPEWQTLKGTEYVSTHVQLSPGKNIIWHASSTMAVYFIGKMGNALFGNPAPIISKTPDFRGCVLTPEVVKIGVAGGWRESLKYCRDNNLELISFPTAQHQKQIYRRLIKARNDGLRKVWIGMRQSSLTGKWYWLNQAPVNSTNWEKGEPGTVQDGNCVIMSLEANKNFGWSDKDCCQAARPVCYGDPVLLPV
ncbi:hypothetical protein PAMP_002518 [Pampus punctatissimus]